MMEPVLACDCRCELAEGPVWHDHALYWVDIVRGDLYRLADGTGVPVRRHAGGLLGAAAPAGGPHWILAKDDGFSLFHWETGETRHWHDPEAHLPENRFNDGKCDPQGRFWAGTMHLRGEMNAGGALHVFDRSLVSRTVLGGVSLSNGLGWSPDGRFFYHIDTHTRRIEAFAFDGESGTLSGRRTLHEVPEGQGWPDGMTVDARGNLWVALWGGGAVICVDPETGKEIARVRTPVSQPSSCTFGGEDLETLFITSAWQDLTPGQRAAEPLAGSIFQVKPGVRGLPVNVFALPDFLVEGKK